MALNLTFINSSYHFHRASFHWNKKACRYRADFVSIGYRLTLIHIHLIYINHPFIYRSYLFEYWSQHTARATPLGIKIHYRRTTAFIFPLCLRFTIISHTLQEFSFCQMNHTHKY